MACLDQVLEFFRAFGHFFFFVFILLPYYYLDAIIFRKNEKKSVKGEIVLITGTGHGIGKHLAIKYATEGAIVICWDVNETRNSKTIQEIKKRGYSSVYGYKVDVSNRKDVLDAAKDIQETIGDVTILINNAGIMPHHSFLEHTEEEIRRIMDINVMAHFWTLQAFLPAMKRNNHGHVVCLSSLAGIVGLMNLVPYNASKFAVRGLMEGLHEEFRTFPNNRVFFTTIYPYMVDTGLCTNYEITYPGLLPILKQEYVAKEIFGAQTTNKRRVLIPEYIGRYLNWKLMFIPEKARNYLTDNFKADLLSDFDLQSNDRRKN